MDDRPLAVDSGPWTVDRFSYLSGMKSTFREYSLIIILTVIGPALGAQQKPNIIIFIGDDISYNDFGCYGHPVIRTPNIDRLARNGLRFTNAFLTTSSCSPSRTSIITGRYPHNTGAAELHSDLPDNQIPFPRLLRNAGYYTAQAGKWHFGSGQSEPGDAMSGAFDRTGGHVGDGGGSSGAERWVEYVRERPDGKPFFMWFAAHDAHRGWDDDFVPVHYKASDVVVPPFLRDTPATREDLALYYGEVSRFDHYIGKVIEELEDQDVLGNTIVVVMADNGRPFPRNKTRMYDEGIKTPFVIHWPEGIPQNGLVSNSLISAVDIAPTIMDVSGVLSPGTFQGRSFRNLLRRPGKKFRTYVFAEHNWHDFMAYERMVRTEQFLYIENGLPERDNRGAIDIMGGGAGRELQKGLEEGKLTDLQERIFLTPQPEKEFYDCRNDSLQVDNLTAIPDFKKQQQQLARILALWKDQTGDSQPSDLTGDWYDRITNRALPEKGKRGTMPGARNHAHQVHHPGPF